MAPDPKDIQISTLLVDESFAAQDDRFVDQIRLITSSKYLAGLADRWKKDPRPWARQQIFGYLALPLDRPGHHPVVKRLFKQAEHDRDTELMAAFLVAFDRLVRRRRRTRYHYDYQTNQLSQQEELFTPHDQIMAGSSRYWINPRTGERIHRSPRAVPKHGRLFSYRTRGYLRRRACRYFRYMGFQRPAEYCQAVAAAFTLYRDEDVAKGENILDNWSLMYLAFHRSPVLEFKRTRVEVADGQSLGALVAAPQFEALWKTPAAAAVLLELVAQASSRLVRVWAMQLLKRDHTVTLQAISAEQLLMLLDHADQEVQQFGAGQLETLSGLDRWPITLWLRLLETRSLTALTTITETMGRRVSPQRLNLEQCVSLACVRATPVARLGLSWLMERPLESAADRAAIVNLASARCEALGEEIAQHALPILGSAQTYTLDAVMPFFDSLNGGIRQGAWSWLTPSSPGYNDAALWSRLTETPYDDVRFRLVAALNQRASETSAPPALARQNLSAIWTTVLLNVHRGGRSKLTALRQISQAIAERPDRAEELIPVLAVAIRSVRPPEVRAGLSAILSAVAARPELESTLAQYIPELRLTPPVTAP